MKIYVNNRLLENLVSPVLGNVLLCNKEVISKAGTAEGLGSKEKSEEIRK